MLGKLTVIVTLVITLVAFHSCKKETIDVPISNAPSEFYLIWNQSDSIDSKANLETALTWYFNALGANLNIKNLDEGIEWSANNRIILDYKKLGFNSRAIVAFEKLQSRLLITEEYLAAGGIDLGRWVALTLNNSDHYYEIVGMPRQYRHFIEGQSFASFQGAVKPSSISFGYRKILFPALLNSSIPFVSEEYDLDFTTIELEPKEFEVFDVMANGQLRFGVYDKNGLLINGADPDFSAAGKPTKCMWCHESKVQPIFSSSNSYQGYLSTSEYNDTVNHYNEKLTSYRSKLESLLDYSRKQEHVQMELLYIRYFEPSRKRLSQEWNMSEEMITERLSAVKTHQHYEFPNLGELYYRHEVDPFAPYNSLSTPKEMRETEIGQPKHL